jgi:DNA-binding response OmpR family regulator
MSDSATRVLIVDGDPAEARLLALYLARGRAGEFHSVTEHRLAAGLDRLSREPVDAVLADPDLPDSIGWPTIERLCEAQPEAPVIALLSSGSELATLEAAARGDTDWLSKESITPQLLPAAVGVALAHRSSPPTPPALAPPSPRLRALVVDADALAALVTTEMLRRLGYEACGVTTPATVARMPEATGAAPDLLVIEQTMGGVDGSALLLNLRQRGVQTPAILVSDGPTGPLVSPGAGRTVPLPKPFRLAELDSALRRACLAETPPGAHVASRAR